MPLASASLCTSSAVTSAGVVKVSTSPFKAFLSISLSLGSILEIESVPISFLAKSLNSLLSIPPSNLFFANSAIDSVGESGALSGSPNISASVTSSVVTLGSGLGVTFSLRRASTS